jgi:hypothetical protein
MYHNGILANYAKQPTKKNTYSMVVHSEVAPSLDNNKYSVELRIVVKELNREASSCPKSLMLRMPM